jgi:predicted phage-related endonuclease
MWYLGLTSYGDGTIAWLHTTSEDFRYQDFAFDKEFFAYLIDQATQFWDKHVQGDTPPPITKAKDIDKLYRKHIGGKLVSIPESKIDLYIKYGELQKQIKTLADQQDAIKDEIKLIVGDAEGVECDGKVLFTYKASADTTVFDGDAFKAHHPDLYEQFLITKPGSRRFLRK